MLYRHPLAYLLGLEGVALFRAFSGEYDREFIEARIAEIRTLLDSADRLGDGVEVPEITSIEGYNNRSVDYDERDNSLITLEQPFVREIVDRLPIGVALDVGCGTGRHAAHVPELSPVLSEWARVLRPGGHLVISESPGLDLGCFGNPLVKMGPDGKPGYVSNRRHETSDYLAAALPLGLQVRSCAEPRLGYPLLDPDAKPSTDPIPSNTPPDIWTLHSWAAAAANAAYRDQPAAIIWHFQLADA